jgi:hypothetical protein
MVQAQIQIKNNPKQKISRKNLKRILSRKNNKNQINQMMMMLKNRINRKINPLEIKHNRNNKI